MILVRVPLRISFAGGGSDIPSHYEKHGGAVVSITIDKYIYITAKPCTDLFPHSYRLVYSKVEEVMNRMDIKHPIIHNVVKRHGIDRLDLDVMSDVPAGTGLGSSSAFTVGLHAALGKVKDKHTLAELACATELKDLKEPIGKQDQYAAAFGGLNYFLFTKKQVSVRPILLSREKLRELHHSLILIRVPGVRSASSILEKQHKADNSHILSEITNQARWLASYIRDGQIDMVGTIMAEGWELKKSLSKHISNNIIDDIISKASCNGATGGKLLGAGQSGFVLLFCPIGRRYEMLDALRPMNLEYVDFNFDMEGCKVLYG